MPTEHPRDFWIADTALKVMDHENPDMIYILLADLDHFQHSFGAVNNPAEWIEGPAPELPTGCTPKPHYNLVSKRNTRLYKEPILDLIRDVDTAFGNLMEGLKSGGYLKNATIILVSDHNMVNYLYREDIDGLADAQAMLEEAGLAPKKHFFLYGAGSVGLLYWRPEVKAMYPEIVEQAKAELLADQRKAYNHETGITELPWGIMDRADMMNGRPDLEIGPMEFYNNHFVQNGVWPDLAIVMLNGWQIPSGSFNLGGGATFTLFNAGHGAPDTAAVVVSIQGMNFPSQTTCSDDANLSDVAATVANHFGWTFANSVGKPLKCTPSP